MKNNYTKETEEERIEKNNGNSVSEIMSDRMDTT
jgi:hypothetical protein